MTGEEIVNIICAVGLVGWIPILAIFSGIAKVVSAFKGNYPDGRIIISSETEDCDEEE